MQLFGIWLLLAMSYCTVITVAFALY